MALLNTIPLFLNSSMAPQLVTTSFANNPKSGVSDLLLIRKRCNNSKSSPSFRCLVTPNALQRNSANYQPNFWTHDFLQSLNHPYSDLKYEDRAIMLQKEVRGMMKNVINNGDIWETLKLIEHVKRLGLSYHFHNEIVEALEKFLSFDRSNDKFKDRSLHDVALSFRLLREYGYHVSSDVFERFKDEKGKFKARLSRDVEGMLSLYEASFHSYEGEPILDHARAFTGFYLHNLLLLADENTSRTRNNNIVLENVRHALEFPQNRTIERLEARWYITESYGKRKDANWVLLEAAKLDFNIVQSTHQKELQQMSRWWKGMGLASKLSFSRDRIMECFIWTVGMASEPKFSDMRKVLTKVNCLITTLDDVYDVYGTFEELEIFTAAVTSWDIKAVEVLPEYMKICFLALYDTVNEFAYDSLQKHGQNILPYLIKAWSDMLKAFLQEAKWIRDKHLPRFDEYLNNGFVSVAGVLMLTNAYFFMKGTITINKEELDAFHNCHDLLRKPSTILRLLNDLATAPAELQRGEETSSIMCYMRENGATKEDAYKYIHGLLDENWKKMNKDRIIHSSFSKLFVETAINVARISQFTYQGGDGLGAPDIALKNRTHSLIIEPIY